VPGRVEFAAEVRRAIYEHKPDVVAIELPGLFEKQFRQALLRLPEMSVILSLDPDADDRAIYVPVEPADPFVEAARTATEMGAELVLVEPHRADRPHVSGLYPDSYAVKHIGRKAFG